MRIAWFDAGSGASGDMILGALVDAGLSFARLEELPARLGLPGVGLERKEVRRGAFRACQVDVKVDASRQPHRHLKDVRAIIERADLPAGVRTRAIEVFTRLGTAEAGVHGTSIEKVHFHEVGAADALVDIVGGCLGLEELGIAEVYASALAVGSGTVVAEHGVLPVPAPATARLLAHSKAPIDPTPLDGERLTPTGAALLTTWVEQWGPPPPFRLLHEGVGAGRRASASPAGRSTSMSPRASGSASGVATARGRARSWPPWPASCRRSRARCDWPATIRSRPPGAVRRAPPWGSSSRSPRPRP